jgi:adenylate kinase family enzyme
MRRVSVVGSSGSGKSTLARRLAAALEVEYVELDSLFWGPDWSPATADELRDRTRAAIAGEAWVVDGNYQSKLGTLVWERADTVVWLDPPRWRAMWQSISRTARRAATRQELWSGNRETWRGLMFWRGADSVVWWAWTTYAGTRERYAAAMGAASASGPAWHRLRTRREVARFLDAVRDGAGGPPSRAPRRTRR